MINRSMLMSDARHFTNNQAINPYYTDESVDQSLAQTEHYQIRAAFKQAGIAIEHIDSPANSQDGVYTANWGLVRGDTAVLARLPRARASEEAHAEAALKRLGKTVIHVPDNHKFSGQGDALACGNWLFCGSQYRSDEAAQSFAADTLGYRRIQLQTIPQTDRDGKPMINTVTRWPDSFFYDLDLALAVIREPRDGQKGLIAYCPEAFVPESRALLENFDLVEKIPVSLEEAKQGFACNLVSTGETVIMSSAAPDLAKQLRHHGLTVLPQSITELSKGGGFIRCISLTLD